MSEHSDEFYDNEDEFIEAYCMTCRQKTVMDNPEPIWTRRGAPGTRGTCSICGTTVFLMGHTAAHDRLKRPDPVRVSEGSQTKGGRRVPADVTYINYSVSDADFAAMLAEDLNRIGIQTWLAESDVTDVQWATGVHPALVECKHMIVVLTQFGIRATNVVDALEFFAKTGKPIVVAQVQPAELPDELRRKPRFDFSSDYKAAFRELVQALTG
ncbi:MAG: toll/interleukin-1 receptor domain-containing protein [Chloroflexi bacterium]|nr:toll/interleukin-1 receptor domain-containing protein [Chloroflexota bacterium]